MHDRSQNTSMTRSPGLFLVPVLIGFAALMLPAYASVTILLLNHALFMLAVQMCHPTGRAIAWKSTPRMAFTQIAFQLCYLLFLTVLVISPVMLIMRDGSISVLVFSSVTILSAAVVLLRFWPAPASAMIAFKYDQQMRVPAWIMLGRGCRIALDLTRKNRSTLMQGIVPLTLILALTAMPFVIHLIPFGESGNSSVVRIATVAVYLIILAPGASLYVFRVVDRRLSSVATQQEQQPGRPVESSTEPAVETGLELEGSGEIMTQVSEQQSSFMTAAKQCDLSQLQSAADTGCDFNEVIDGRVALIEIINSRHGDRLKAIDLLLDHQADINLCDADAMSALHHACKNDDEAATARLLSNSADTNLINNEELSPLALSCRIGKWNICKQLIDAGASVNTKKGVPPLITAASTPDDDVTGVDMLITAGAGANITAKLGRTALMNAAMQGNAVIAETLLKAGANINDLDNLNNSALMDAARSGANNVIERFVFWNPKTEFKDKLGRTVLLIAVSSKRADPETIRLLLTMGANPQAQNKQGKDAAEMALETQRPDIARALGVEAQEEPPQVAQVQESSDDDENIIDFTELEAPEDMSWAQNEIGLLKSKRISSPVSAPGTAPVSDIIDEATTPSGVGAVTPPSQPVTPAQPASTTVAASASNDEYNLMPDDIIIDEQHVIIDMSELVNDDDREWAERQFKKRSRTQLESAKPVSSAAESVQTDPAPVNAVVDDDSFQLEPENIPVPGKILESESTSATTDKDTLHEIEALSESLESLDETLQLDSVIDLDAVMQDLNDDSAWAAEPVDAVTDLKPETAQRNEQVDETATQTDLSADSIAYQSLIDAASEENTDLMGTILLSTTEVPDWWMSSVFLHALAKGCLLSPVWLLDNGLDANAQCANGLLLLDATLQQATPDPQVIEALIKHGARIDKGGEQLVWLSGLTDHQHEVSPSDAHDSVAEERKTELLKTLIEYGSDARATGEDGRNALHWAVLYRSKSYVKTLLELGLDPNQRDGEGSTALLHAVNSDNPHRSVIVRQLIKAGADPLLVNDDDESAMSAAMNLDDRSISRLLMMARMDPSSLNKAVQDRPVDIITAAANGNLGRVKRLIARGDDINITDPDDVSALIHASGKGHVAVVNALLAAGANTRQVTRGGTTALAAAVLGNHIEVVRTLTDAKVPVDQKQANGITPLMLAAARWNVKLVGLLLDKGADPNETDQSGGTALMAAAQNGIFSVSQDQGMAVFQCLMDHGAMADAINDEGQTALMMLLGVRADSKMTTAKPELEELTKTLIRGGAQLDAQDLTGWSALHAAAAHGFHKPAKILITAGANKRLRDINGLSACDLAMDKNDDQLVSLFID